MTYQCQQEPTGCGSVERARRWRRGRGWITLGRVRGSFMPIRVVGGFHRGRTLRAPRGEDTRPTSDRTREAIFNMLGPLPPHCRALDLCAGSGAMGIEALSRGAGWVDLVDRAAPVGGAPRRCGGMAAGERAHSSLRPGIRRSALWLRCVGRDRGSAGRSGGPDRPRRAGRVRGGWRGHARSPSEHLPLSACQAVWARSRGHIRARRFGAAGGYPRHGLERE